MRARPPHVPAPAQRAFSRHIRSLEKWVGLDLFDRSTHPAGLTAEGQRFLPLLEQVLASLEAARIKARAAHDLAAASLRFAATHVLSIYFFPRGWPVWSSNCDWGRCRPCPTARRPAKT